MRVNPETIRKWREQRAWSQEHLAEAAGLSLRTIQRVEAEGKASNETRMALASAFGCNLADLDVVPEATPSAAPAVPGPVLFDADPGPRRRVFVILPAVALFLLFLDWRSHQAVTWSRWSLLGLAAAMAAIGIKRMLVRRFPGRSRPKGLLVHAVIYALTCAFLAVMDWRVSGGITWSQWPMIGWGLGLGLHGLLRLESRFRKSPASI